VSCPTCGAENRDDARFCLSCGSSLARTCPNGHPVPAEARFCDECGASLGAPAAETPRPETPAAERRLVSVLFTDLVGFTAASEQRDAEETRELLSQYFEIARTLIGRYGGEVEKFIGDAVMAVWGTPIATEDDAERAVRAALELVDAVPELDPALQARAGVLTGEAAVTIGAEGQGMVAGDLVNTASRVQSAAEPGTVLVGETTKRASEQAVVYETAGVHDLKGKTEPVELFQALRVVSARQGALKSAGLEAPFVGRDRELKLVKSLFHASAQDRRAHLVSITGTPGYGKSRLAWEFEKYMDGIVEQVWWHKGRCLAYGEGVAYWALADMVRMRCRIAEDEPAESMREKLKETLEEHVPDPEERSFMEPRLANLLGVEDGSTGDRQDLFAAWRLLFERLADTGPTVLAFEDMHWADAGLLDFVEYLLEWSRDYPLFVITLARPDLQERRPGWGAGQRNFTSLYLEALPNVAMESLLDGLAPGLPARLREQILDRAEGVPLYAMETVRMLLDRGLLIRDGAVYRPTGEIDTLEVPETLHALIAARLDGVSSEERRVLQDGAVLGKTFSKAALSALSKLSEADLEPLLSSLARKEVLGVQSDPRSPEHGQYGFLQDLVRHVAYETLSKRERKSRHLAAAAHLENVFADEDDVAEVLASHYLAAVEAAPESEDAVAIRAKAREMLARAGERARSLGAPEEGQRYFDQAAVLADEPVEQAHLLEQSGRLALVANRSAAARERLEQAIGLFEQAGDRSSAARASVALADVDATEARLDEAAARLEQAVAALQDGTPDAALAGALAQLGRMRVLAGHTDASVAPLERALELAERLQLPDVFVEALNSKAIVLGRLGRNAEAKVLLEAAVARAHEEQLYAGAFRAQNNLGVFHQSADRYAEALEVIERSLALARRRGDRRWESNLRTGEIEILFMLGRWDEVLAVAADEEPLAQSINARASLTSVALVHSERGDLQAARAILRAHEVVRDSDQIQGRASYDSVDARVLRAEGRAGDALAAAERVLDLRPELAVNDITFKMALVEGVEAALELADVEKAEELLRVPESLDPGELTPFLQGNAVRLRARLEAARGTDGTGERLLSAAALFREFGMVFYLAVTLLEHAELTGDEGSHAEAREIFEGLNATPWLERASAAQPVPA
jgi:class 3 adenylate cyclase/tetratricopeptide (TPR) repeat protein